MTLSRLIASGFCSGYAPRAPGTAGSLAALAVGAVLLWCGHGWLALAVLVAAGAGMWAIGAAATGDPGWVVIDEFAGQWLAMLALARATPLGLLLAFALFRLFDIAKPGPVGWIDRRHGPWAVMGDDLAAGAMTAVLLLSVRLAWPWVLA